MLNFSQYILNCVDYQWPTSLSADLDSNTSLLAEDYRVLSRNYLVQIMKNTFFIVNKFYFFLVCMHVQLTETPKVHLFWFSMELNKKGSWQFFFFLDNMLIYICTLFHLGTCRNVIDSTMIFNLSHNHYLWCWGYSPKRKRKQQQHKTSYLHEIKILLFPVF